MKKNKIKKYFLNKKYFWLGSLFFIWMSFFDTNSFLTYLSLIKDKQKTIKEIDLLKNQIQEGKELLQKIKSDPDFIAKAARKIGMKKPQEDIFIITRKSKK